jgi:D-3-phosphoglycerate dehydrogenase
VLATLTFAACEELNIPIINTHDMFGGEVAGLAITLLLGLARETYYIYRESRINNGWPKPVGMSIAGKLTSSRLW